MARLKLLSLFMRLLTSPFGLLLINMTYLLLGAWLFLAIEAPREASLKNNLEEERDLLVDFIIAQGLGPEEYYRGNASERLASYEQQLASFYRKRATFEMASSNESLSDLRLWSYEGAIIYCYSVITTIGWGNIVPNTRNGKLGTVIYGLNGMPLFFSLSSEVGTLCSKLIFVVWNLFRRTVLPFIKKQPTEQNKSGSKSMPRPPKDCGVRHEESGWQTRANSQGLVTTSCSRKWPAGAYHGGLAGVTSAVGLPDSTGFCLKRSRYKPMPSRHEGARLLHRSRNSVYLKNARSCIDYMLYAHTELRQGRVPEDLPHFRIQTKEDAFLLMAQFSRMSTDELITGMEYAGFDYGTDVLGRTNTSAVVPEHVAGTPTLSRMSRVPSRATDQPMEGTSRARLSSGALLQQGSGSSGTSCVINMDPSAVHPSGSLQPRQRTHRSPDLAHTPSIHVLNTSKYIGSLSGHQGPVTMSGQQGPVTKSGHQGHAVSSSPGTKQIMSCVKGANSRKSRVNSWRPSTENSDASMASIDMSTKNTDMSTAYADAGQSGLGQRVDQTGTLAGSAAGVQMLRRREAPDDDLSWPRLTLPVELCCLEPSRAATKLGQISQRPQTKSQKLRQIKLLEHPQATQASTPHVWTQERQKTDTWTHQGSVCTNPATTVKSQPGSAAMVSYWSHGSNMLTQPRRLVAGASLCPAGPGDVAATDQQCRFTENDPSRGRVVTSPSVDCAETGVGCRPRFPSCRSCTVPVETRISRPGIIDRFVSMTDAARDQTGQFSVTHARGSQTRMSTASIRRTGAGHLRQESQWSVSGHSCHNTHGQELHQETQQPRHAPLLDTTQDRNIWLGTETSQVDLGICYIGQVNPGDLTEHVREQLTPGDLTKHVREQVTPGDLTEHVREQLTPGDLTKHVREQLTPGDLTKHVREQLTPGDLTNHHVGQVTCVSADQRSRNQCQGQCHKHGDANENHDKERNSDDEDSDDVCTVYSSGRMHGPRELDDDDDDEDIEFISGRGFGFVWTDILDMSEEADVQEQLMVEEADEDEDRTTEDLELNLAALEQMEEPFKSEERQGQMLQRFHVPLFVMYTLVIVYVLLGSAVFYIWDKKLDFWDSLYFIYVMLSTTGFGDLLPQPEMYGFIVVYGLVGMALYNIMINATLELFIEVLEYLATIGGSTQRDQSV